jgi:hypothetical protein
MAIELAPTLAATNAGTSAVKVPVGGRILNWETKPEAVSTTYKKLP